MRFRSSKRRSSLPEIDLVPLLDVLMSVLTFFIALSLSLTEQIISDLRLPQMQNAGRSGSVAAGQNRQPTNQPPPPPNTLEIALNRQGNILVAGQLINNSALEQLVNQHFTKYPQAILTVKADRALPYGQISRLLQRLQAIGGKRISLTFTRS
ncbi:MAG: biopolymer transporter ExbD [Oscillatoriales cyanobacterium]|nr:MAG: biopolymer transporter ExbD [Oscillatoriales cyanobacterium]